jgi:hypothetical protein
VSLGSEHWPRKRGCVFLARIVQSRERYRKTKTVDEVEYVDIDVRCKGVERRGASRRTLCVTGFDGLKSEEDALIVNTRERDFPW